MQNTIGYVAIILCDMASFAAAVPPQSQPHVEELQAAVARIATEAKGFDEPRARIEELPREETIIAVVNALDKGIYREAKIRSFAYWVLAILDGANTEGGYAQLFACLDDSSGLLGLCASALTKAPAEKLPEVAARLAVILTAEKTSPKDQEIVLKALAKIGKPAHTYLGTVESILTNPQGNERIRAFAAIAVLNIGGAERAVEILPKLDPVALKKSINALYRFGGESEGTFGTDDKEVRGKLRAFIRECMRNPDREIRQAALQAFLSSFTKEEAKLGNDAEGYIINPELRDALEFMAKNDPDDELRAAPRQILDRADEELRVEGKGRKQP